MLTLERQQEILDILKTKKSIKVEELSKELFVSGATVRRDLRLMESKGLIKRSHGGAMLFSPAGEESAFALRENANTSAKKTIALLASGLIKNGQTIFLDSSSTTGAVIPFLNNFKYLTVTTTGLKNALLLSSTSTVKIYIAGGLIANHSNSIMGTDTIDYISRIHADITLVSCMGVDVNAGFTDSSIEQAKIKQQMRKNSTELAVLCDSAKFKKIYMCTDFTFQDVDYLVTEKLPPKEILEEIKKSKCKLICPEQI